MTIVKRGNTCWTEFIFKGQRVRQSTKTSIKARAEEFERKLRNDLHEQVVLGRTKEMTFGEATDHYIESSLNAFHTRSDRGDGLSAARFPIVFISGEHDHAPGVQTMAAEAERAHDAGLIVMPDLWALLATGAAREAEHNTKGDCSGNFLKAPLQICLGSHRRPRHVSLSGQPGTQMGEIGEHR